jgi:hypothetical protein
MKAIPYRRHITDTRTVLSVTLSQPNESGVDTVVNLTGLTVKFAMYNTAGTVVISPTTTGVTVETAASGTVRYDFSTAGAATAGVYYAYFIVDDAGETDHYPAQSRGLKVLIDGHAVTAEEADAA